MVLTRLMGIELRNSSFGSDWSNPLQPPSMLMPFSIETILELQSPYTKSFTSKEGKGCITLEEHIVME